MIHPRILDDGRWLWEISPGQFDLGILQKLCRFRSPNMVFFEEAGINNGVLTLVGQNPGGFEPLPSNPKIADLSRWSLHLAELARQLEHIGFPFNPCVRGLALKEGQILVLDPGLEEFLLPGEVQSDAIQRFGEIWGELTSEALPAHLEWISARCRSDSVIRYQSFAEIHEAFHQALVVELPESGQHVTKIKPLKNFQVPWLAQVRRVPWERVWLLLALVSLLGGLVWSWWNRPLPPRNYPAAALILEGQLQLLDLNTGQLRARPVLSSALVHALATADTLWLCCRGERTLFRLDGRSLKLSQGPVIEPDPALMMSETGGRRVYLLYPQKFRILVVELPKTPLFYLDIWPDCRFLAPIPLSSGRPGLLVASQDKLKCFGLQSRLPEVESEWKDLSGLVVDAKNRIWILREFGLIRVDPEMQIMEQHPLPASPRQLISVGQRLVCALPDRLLWLEADSTWKEVAAGQPGLLAPDPQNPDRLWLVENENQLVQRELRGGRSLKKWILPGKPSGLVILPLPR